MVYLYDTGEVLVGKTKYADIQTKQADFSVTYVKMILKKVTSDLESILNVQHMIQSTIRQQNMQIQVIRKFSMR